MKVYLARYKPTADGGFKHEADLLNLKAGQLRTLSTASTLVFVYPTKYKALEHSYAEAISDSVITERSQWEILRCLN